MHVTESLVDPGLNVAIRGAEPVIVVVILGFNRLESVDRPASVYGSCNRDIRVHRQVQQIPLGAVVLSLWLTEGAVYGCKVEDLPVDPTGPFID